ncbi:DUF4013 domain-containing protein [Haloferax larsenii]|uniref:DUF4013 domain-containing protein n=1 Tax=Haloferax larsenii TaxID=302484 RepID=A0A1H7RHV4_HALLR|nr:DUF4013 domain-containing protein [Haloferax larsenii]SEL59816.1 Protein of unknown function [Haloferax larsenii]
MLSDALWFLKRSDDWFATTIIGAILSLLSVLILPGILLQGYYVRTMQAATRGDESAPSFTDWGGMFVDGLKLFVVTFVWSLLAIVPSVAFFAIVGVGSAVVSEAASAPGAAPSTAGSLGLGVIGLVGMLLVTGLSLLVSYLVPAAGANFAINGSLRAGFDVRTILKGALTSEYAIAWVLAIVVAVVLGTVGSVLAIILVGLLILFYAQVTTYYLWARGFADGVGMQSGW